MTDLNTADSNGWVIGLQQFGVVARQDIDVLLLNSPDTFNLFVLALKELQKPSQVNNKMAFFQMAGIHGLPNAPWDNVKAKGSVDGQGDESGYCNHGSVTFPTWHRPYLSMFEQALFKKMQEIAASYTNPQRKTVYQAAVKNFRLPYIDYHRPRNYNVTFPGVVNPQNGTTFYPYDFAVPQVLTLANIAVKDFPNDNSVVIPNPLSSFNFLPGSPISNNDWRFSGINTGGSIKQRTMRYPPGNDFGQNDALLAINAAVNEIREETIRLSLLFVENGGYNRYETFATAGTTVLDPFDGQTASGSLESVHGNYHVFIGGSGHMSSVPTAAFDPIFWLHHCTIDRWFAVWQKAHPNGWFASSTLAAKPLLPFRNAKNPSSQPYWTSEQSKTTDLFGYTYPELVGFTTPAALQAKFKNQYSWARRLTSTPQAEVRPPPEFEPLDLSRSQFFQGVQGFKPLNRSSNANILSANILMPVVANTLPQPTRRAFTIARKAVAQPGPATATKSEPSTPAVTTAKSDVQASKSADSKDAAAKSTQPVTPVAAAVADITTAVKTAAAAVGALSISESPKPTPPMTTAPHSPINEFKVSREWYVDDVIERMALNTSFTVFYFIGKFENADSLVGLLMAPTFAGLNHIFAAPVEACDNCGSQAEISHIVRSTSPVTSMLLDYVTTGELVSMRPEHVRPFLVANLKWRVVTVDGRVINPRELSANHGFKNSVSCKISPLPHETGDVVYETYTDIPEEIIRHAS